MRLVFFCFLFCLSNFGCLSASNGWLNTDNFVISPEDRAFIEAFPYSQYRICTIPNQGEFFVDISADTIKERLFQGLPWEPSTDEIIRKYVVPGTTVLDIGAHIGTHTIPMSRAVGDTGTVVAFEPQQKIFRELCMNVALNCCNNVHPLHVALGAEAKIAYLGEMEPRNEGGRAIETSGCEKVQMRTLDEYNINNISFIKMDVENFEDEVIEGAKKTLLRNRPVLFLEIQGNKIVAARRHVNCEEKIRKTIRRLEKLGYSVTHFSGDDYLALPVTKK